MNNHITLRIAADRDIASIAELFRETIQAVNIHDYNEKQVAVWASGAENQEKWERRVREQYFVLAEITGQLAGFGSLTDSGYLDVLYVSKNHLRLGVATELYQAIEQRAIKQRNERLFSDVSITAKPFFERMGFIIVRKQIVERQGVSLINFRMEKRLVTKSCIC